jgi:hypothetical protein
MIDSLFVRAADLELNQPPFTAADREFSRIPFRGRAAAILMAPPSDPNAEPLESEVLTTDISRGGLSVLLRTEMAVGQHILLMLSRSSRTVEVCWCCQVWPGLFAAGCRFLDGVPASSKGRKSKKRKGGS